MPVASAFLNELLLTAHPVPVCTGDVLTLVSHLQDPRADPALDSNTELLCSWPGILADLLRDSQHTCTEPAGPPPAQTVISDAISVDHSSDSIADTDASASHHDGFIDTDEPQAPTQDMLPVLEAARSSGSTSRTTTQTATTLTTTDAQDYRGPIILAFATPGDRPRSIRLGPGEHVGLALWEILADPTRVLQDFSAWTLSTCPRTFPDVHGERLVLTTLSTLPPPVSDCWCWTNQQPKSCTFLPGKAGTSAVS